MATGAEAIQVVAKVTGKRPGPVGRAARSLREARCDLWPQAAPGGGKNSSHVRPKHLVNLGVALAVADPLTESAQQIGAFTSLVAGPAHFSTDGPVAEVITKWKRIVGAGERHMILGDTLGEALAGLVDWLSRPEGAELGSVCKGINVELKQQDGCDPSAVLSYFGDEPKNGDNWDNFSTYAPHNRMSADQVHAAELRAPGAIERTTLLPLGLFKTLADLWTDTKAAEGRATAMRHSQNRR